jgi:hypothetical protein
VWHVCLTTFHVGAPPKGLAAGSSRQLGREAIRLQRGRLTLDTSICCTAFDALDATNSPNDPIGDRKTGWIAPSSAVRMIGAPVAFVAGLHIEFVATREEALRRLEQKRRSAAH